MYPLRVPLAELPLAQFIIIDEYSKPAQKRPLSPGSRHSPSKKRILSSPFRVTRCATKVMSEPGPSHASNASPARNLLADFQAARATPSSTITPTRQRDPSRLQASPDIMGDSTPRPEPPSSQSDAEEEEEDENKENVPMVRSRKRACLPSPSKQPMRPSLRDMRPPSFPPPALSLHDTSMLFSETPSRLIFPPPY